MENIQNSPSVDNAKVDDERQWIDPYFALLEYPGLRIFGIKGARIPHRTQSFHCGIYESSSNLTFDTDEDAYRHWLLFGRKQGYVWADGKDTMLKIILKAKDETDLIDVWIAHHANIVGYENLIIMDCGSTDPAYIAKLAQWSDKILILRYWSFYNDLHAASWNRDFYELLAENARYIAVLDTDEFLFGRSGIEFSPKFLKRTLEDKSLDVFCGIWIDAAYLPSLSIGRSASVAVRTSPDLIRAGSFAGKSVVSTKKIFDCEHIGHNMHFAALYDHISEASFGEIIVFHLTTLPPAIAKARTLRKLVSLAKVTGDDAMIQQQIEHLATAEGVNFSIRDYARFYLAMSHEGNSAVSMVEDQMTFDLLTNKPQQHSALALMIEETDFKSLIQRSFSMVSSWGQKKKPEAS